MALLQVGSEIPVFEIKNQEGKIISESDFLGNKIILYFYPKDSTPGCTAEACSLKDDYKKIQKLGYTIFGVSADSESSHKKFIEKNKLPFDLLADTEKVLINLFGAWGQKSMMGKVTEGIIRSTFIINEEGIITHVIDKVETKTHAEQILDTINNNNIKITENMSKETKEVKETKETKEPKSKVTKEVKETIAINPEKAKALELALDKIEKSYGKGTIMKLGDHPAANIDSISSGSLGVDVALGVGGFPKGRVIEIYGPESSGKTTLAIHAIAEAQKKGGIAAFIDAEHAFDSIYAQKLGVDINNLLVSQPDNGEQALEITENLIRSGAIDIIIIDSVAALTPKSEIEGEMGDSKMGLQARLMSQALRKLTATISKTGCCCVFINQLRDKIGVMFGNPETTTGGNALKFYSSVRVDIRRISQIKEGDNVIGNRAKVKIVKNKVAPPFRTAEFDIIYGEGISKAGEIVDLGVDYNIVKKSGSWFSYGETKLAQGREATKQMIIDNPEMAEEIENKIKEAIINAANK